MLKSFNGETSFRIKIIMDKSIVNACFRLFGNEKKSLSFKFEDNMIKFSLQNIKLQINSTKLWAVSRSFNFVMKKCKLE